jgi:hypothetical protein
MVNARLGFGFICFGIGKPLTKDALAKVGALMKKQTGYLTKCEL